MTSVSEPIPCPLPECGAPLNLVTNIARHLTLADLLASAPPYPAMDSSYTKDWFVGCDNHHVVLLPGPIGCEDGNGPGCVHNVDDYDWSEYDRTFRTHDLARLGELCVALNGIDVPHGP